MIDYEKQTHQPHTIADFKLPVNAIFLAKYNSDTKQKKCYTFDNQGYLLKEEDFKDKQLQSQKHYKYSGNYRLDEIIETDADGRMILTVIYRYNEADKLVDIVHKQQNHVLNYQVTNGYDKNNKLVKKTIYDITGNRFVRQIYYDDLERAIEVHIFDHLEDRTTYKFYHKYDQNNRLIQRKQVPEQESGTRISCEMNYSYNSNGYLAEMTSKNLDNSTTVSKYNDKGDILEVLSYNPDNRLINSHSYLNLSANSEEKIILYKTYDQSGNITCEDFQGLDAFPRNIQLIRDDLGRITAELKIYSNDLYDIENYDIEENRFNDLVIENNQTDNEVEAEIIEEHLAIKKDFGSYKKYEEWSRQEFSDSNYEEPIESECVYKFMEIRYL